MVARSGSGIPSGSNLRDDDNDYRPDRPDRGSKITPISLFLVLLLCWVLFRIQLVLILGLLALLLGTILEGPIQRIEARRVPRPAAIAMVYAIMVGIIALLVISFVNPISEQADEFREEAPQQFRSLQQDWEASSNPLLNGIGADLLGRGIDFLEEPGSTVSGNSAEAALPVLMGIGTALVSTLTLFVITFYYLLEKSLIRRVILDQIHPDRRARVNRIWEDAERKVGGWMRGQLLLCFIIGSIATVSYAIIDLRFWPLLGLWAGITEIIPIIGPWLGGIPAVLIAMTMGWQTAIFTACVILGMQTLENWFLVPRVMRGAVGLTPLTVFVAILAGTQLLGVVGALLAIPVAATVQVIVTDILDRRRGRQNQPAMSGWRWMLTRGPLRDDFMQHEHAQDRQPQEFVSYEDQIESTMSPGADSEERDHDTTFSGYDPSGTPPPAGEPSRPWSKRSESNAGDSRWGFFGASPQSEPATTTSDPPPKDRDKS
jgi:predicted PurR-regulated permease PerM